MSFKQKLVNDMASTFVNANEFAEQITYTPYGGSAVVRAAVVVRERINPGSEDGGRMLQNQAEIYIVNDATYGVSSVNIGNDLVSFTDLNGIMHEWLVLEVMDADNGSWHLLVQK